MEFERRKLKRKPLSDCTNIPSRSLTAKHPKPLFSALKPSENSSKYNTSTGSNNAELCTLQTLPSTSPRPKSPLISVDADHENSKITTVLRQRQIVAKTNDKGKPNSAESAKTKDKGQAVSVEPTKTKDKGKAVSIQRFSCPPPRRLRDELDTEQGDIHKLNKKQGGVDLSDIRIGSDNAEVSTLQTLQSTPLPQSFPIFVDADHDKVTTVFRRRQTVAKTKDKGKAVSVVPFSCPPPRRLRNIWDEPDKEQEDELDKKQGAVRLSSTVPRPKKQRSAKEAAVPQDFIDKQRAYFAEIDAFELPEEEVSESELE